MRIRHFRLSNQAKEQLIRLKTRTGIDNWNILCRWAFCLSLREESPPTPIEVPADSNVEMTWQVFGGEAADLYLAVLIERCVRDGIELEEREVGRQFRLHLQRGIGYLASPRHVSTIADLARLAISKNAVPNGRAV